VVLLVLRLVVGGNLAWLHGWDKLHHFAAKAGSYPDPLGLGSKYSLVLAVAGEFFAAILMATGFLSRIAAFFVSVTTALTLFWVLLLGSGRFSLDSLVWKKLGKGGGKSTAPAKR
jgi:putative oxidoreductase